MERATPVRKPHTSTSDLLTWSETPLHDSPATAASATPAIRSHQPSDGVSKVLLGGQVTDEEAESLMKRRPCSGYKLKEISGSGIFAAEENGASESDGANSAANNRTTLRMYQQAVAGISQISFSAEESITPKKPVSLTEVAKQRELSGTLESESDAKLTKQFSDAKCKELNGNDIFGSPPEILPRTVPSRDLGESAPRNAHSNVNDANSLRGQNNTIFGEEAALKTAKKIHNQKFAELNGNDIFKGDTPPGSAEKSLSNAKLREMSGNNIFADGKAESRDYFGGVRKPPGGGSSIALI